MKIAYLANIRFPSERAHATQIAHMCQAFVSNDCVVDLVVDSRQRDTKVAVDSCFGIDSKFSLLRISRGYFNPKIKVSFYLSELVFAINAFRVIKNNKYDFVFSRSEWILYTLSFFLPIQKLIWESHEAKSNFPARRLLSRGIKTVVISDGIQDEYLKNGALKEQMLVAYDAIDESFFEDVLSREKARKSLGLDVDKKLIGYIGGFDEWKGMVVFCEAAASSVDKQYVVIGGSEAEVRLYKKKFPNVLFLGSFPYADLKNNQQAFDVLVVPNTNKTALSALYTSPLKLFAHIASGVPVVVSDVQSLVSVTGKELVTVFTPDSPQALAQAVEAVFNNYEAKKSQALMLKEQAKMYTWTERAKKILGFISA